MTYDSPGSKTVKLTVNGSSTETKTDCISVTGVTSTGVPYTWLDAYDLVVEGDHETAAGNDHNGNGLPAWQEYATNLDPTDPSSRLPELTLLTGEDGIIGISIEPTSPDRYYDLLFTVDLLHPEWQEIDGSLGSESPWRFDFDLGRSKARSSCATGFACPERIGIQLPCGVCNGCTYCIREELCIDKERNRS